MAVLASGGFKPVSILRHDGRQFWPRNAATEGETSLGDIGQPEMCERKMVEPRGVEPLTSTLPV